VRAHGPFATSRHPLNFAFCALVWLEPRMTTTLAAFQALATLHLLAGSWHEESRLAARFGAPYEAYRRSGVPFFVPGWGSEELSTAARAGSSSTGRSRLSALGEPQL
jgi:protein-S-isoprenylcysteine O-methyltransferase Ste14